MILRTGPRNLISDVDGILVGNASDDTLRSGVTVVTSERPLCCSVAVMGGAPGTRETDLLAPDKTAPGVDALVLSGGSAFGLAAAQGVMESLAERGRGFAVGSARVPIVPAAILFDLLNGGDKSWGANPYPALGRRGAELATRDFALGSVGAGAGATTAMLKGGLGSASVVLNNGATVGALVAVNPVGCVTTPGERYFWAAPFETGSEFGGLGPDPQPGARDLRQSRKLSAHSAQANTTIAVVATDVALTKAQAHRMAITAHDGIARAIVPAHSPLDGDLVFSASTHKRKMKNAQWEMLELCNAAALCLSRAIARGVYEARAYPDDAFPSWADVNGARPDPA